MSECCPKRRVELFGRLQAAREELVRVQESVELPAEQPEAEPITTEPTVTVEFSRLLRRRNSDES